jgi:hypothetical protein
MTPTPQRKTVQISPIFISDKVGVDLGVSNWAGVVFMFGGLPE